MADTCPQPFIDLAHRLADASADVIRRHFRTPVAVDDKADDSPVTIADRDSEAIMRFMVEREFPDHGIVGEEHGVTNPGAEWVWVFDPIDGTKAFITGKPSFGTLIALLHGGVPVLGMINQPIIHERWVGATGRGATLNGTAIQTRACDALGKASMYTTDPTMFKGGDMDAFRRLESQVKLRRFGADCYAYGLLAGGWIDLVCEADLKLYDFAAVMPIITEAGGLVTDWQGKIPGFDTDGRILAAGDAQCHRLALEALKG
ncbi:MAG: histidinol phosphate phosphatase [Rhodospirillaceae bacterium BRH_c57]|nr:MAG: histidinol phosphate phosphatase [Rhodospirillaceae bacterium BRH_c57]